MLVTKPGGFLHPFRAMARWPRPPEQEATRITFKPPMTMKVNPSRVRAPPTSLPIRCPQDVNVSTPLRYTTRHNIDLMRSI